MRTGTRQIWGVLLLGGAIGLAGLAWWVAGGVRAGDGAGGTRPGGPADEVPEPATGQTARAGSEREVDGAIPHRGVVPGPMAEPPPGWLQLEARDAWTGEPLHVDLRLLAEQRFHHTAGASCRLPLTPGTWRVRLSQRGYDAQEREGILVESAQVTDLGAIALQPGSGGIRGRVRGDGSREHRVTVELHGDPRRPCAECATTLVEGRPKAVDPWTRSRPCKACGFAASHSTRSVQAGEEFRFDGLAAGTCYARWYGPGTLAAGGMQEVTLGVGEQRRLDLALPFTRTLYLELVDGRGAPVEGTWQRDGRTVHSPIRLEFRRRPCGTLTAMVIPRRFLDLESVRLGKAALLEEVFEEFGMSWSEEIMNEEFDVSADAAAPVRVRPVDQPRRPEDALTGAPEVPAHEAVLEAAWEGRWVAVRAVPDEALDLVVTCGRWRSAVVPLAPGNVEGRPLRVVLEPQEDPEHLEYVALDWERGLMEVEVSTPWEEASWTVRFGRDR